MKLKIIFLSSFLLFLILPTILMFSDIEKQEKNNENRLLSTFNFSSINLLKSTIINIKNVYQDSYGGKFFLYNLYKKNISNPLKESPSNHKVIFGKKGWLFIGDFYNNAFSESKGNLIFTKSELFKLKQNINKAREWCLNNNINFKFIAPPGKHTVCKEFLPYQFPKAKTKLDQIQSIYPLLIDIRQRLASKDTRFYYKTDTHWNEYGAFEGYLAFMESLELENKNLKKLSKRDIKLVSYNTFIGDITRILTNSLYEQKPKLNFVQKKGDNIPKQIKVPLYHRLNPEGYEDRFLNKKALNNLKLVVLGDSFSENLKTFLSLTFREVVFIKNHKFDKTIILNEEPNILLYEVTERFVDHLLKIHE